MKQNGNEHFIEPFWKKNFNMAKKRRTSLVRSHVSLLMATFELYNKTIKLEEEDFQFY